MGIFDFFKKKSAPVITNGMSRDSVIAKLGEPTARSDFKDVLGMVQGASISSDIYEQAMSAEHCIFKKSFGEYSVHFEKGEVVQVNFTPK